MSATEYVWGVDPALSRVAVSFAPVDGGRPSVLTLVTHSDTREGQRLGWLDRQLRIAARQWASSWPPAVVWVEQPSGRFRNLQLTYACGVIQAALFEALGVPVGASPRRRGRSAQSASATRRNRRSARGSISSGSAPDRRTKPTPSGSPWPAGRCSSAGSGARRHEGQRRHTALGRMAVAALPPARQDLA